MDTRNPDLRHEPLIFTLADESVTGSHADLVVDVRDHLGRRLLACAEPVDATAAAEEVACGVLATLRRGFLAAGDVPLADTLTQAFRRANREVCENNAWPIAEGRRRALIGVTAVAIAGNDLVAALAPPGQLVVVQNGCLYAFPDLASWEPTFEPSDGVSDAGPLGVSIAFTPRIYATVVAPGDAILVGPAQIGRSLAAVSQCVDLGRHPHWLPAIAIHAGGRAHSGGVAALLPIEGESKPRSTPDRLRASPVTTARPEPSPNEWVEPRMRRAILIDRIRTRAIEMFERLTFPSNSPPARQERAVSFCPLPRPARSPSINQTGCRRRRSDGYGTMRTSVSHPP
jgi:hypothetical protein